MAKTLISLSNVNVGLHTQFILKDVSLNIQTGEHFAVTGKSGSGKSTFLKVLAGLQGINGGTISYGFNATGIAFVDARHHFRNRSNTTDLYYQQRFNSFDAGDAPTVAGYLAAIASENASGYWTIEKVTERLNIKGVYEKELIKLSNGETKRLRLATALLKNPQLLLLDQPFTGLDVDARKSFNELLAEISAGGITIGITISPNEVPGVIAKVIVLDEGKIKNIVAAKNFKADNLTLPLTNSYFNINQIGRLLNTEVGIYHTFIKMTNINVKYGEKAILSNINWEIKQGERWALLGHNGAGKSTLLSLIYGDNPQAYANDIVLFDKQRGTGESIWDIKQKCGFVSPELFQYFPQDNSCLQVIESGFYDTLGLFRQSEPSRAALSLKWMEVLGIGHYYRHSLSNIPASAQRLCLLARALVKSPALLILDEPCQGMDDEQKSLFKNVIDAICRQSNLSLIYVTHYMDELPDAVNRYLQLRDGEIVHS